MQVLLNAIAELANVASDPTPNYPLQMNWESLLNLEQVLEQQQARCCR